ncbi:antitoxin [Streptomyces sp. NBC_01353]|uniref:antitoxin n=1 Tax=Streptomyces sp. NBC_01353 TaxID=2903835 RepID=UPI002E2F6C71|nr:antitoxin [Streptomyces sp. NBC_01353]
MGDLKHSLKGLVGKGRDTAAENTARIEGAIDNAGNFIDEKSGSKSDQTDNGADGRRNAPPEDDCSERAEQVSSTAPGGPARHGHRADPPQRTSTATLMTQPQTNGVAGDAVGERGRHDDVCRRPVRSGGSRRVR